MARVLLQTVPEHGLDKQYSLPLPPVMESQSLCRVGPESPVPLSIEEAGRSADYTEVMESAVHSGANVLRVSQTSFQKGKIIVC